MAYFVEREFSENCGCWISEHWKSETPIKNCFETEYEAVEFEKECIGFQGGFKDDY